MVVLDYEERYSCKAAPYLYGAMVVLAMVEVGLIGHCMNSHVKKKKELMEMIKEDLLKRCRALADTNGDGEVDGVEAARFFEKVKVTRRAYDHLNPYRELTSAELRGYVNQN